jgi:hypothetical protein
MTLFRKGKVRTKVNAFLKRMGVLLIAAFVCRGGVVMPSYAAAPVQLAGLDLNGIANQLINQTVNQIKNQKPAKNQQQSTPTNSTGSQVTKPAQNVVPQNQSGTGRTLYDNFAADSGLNLSLWTTQSSFLNALAANISSTFLTPTLSFSSVGMEMSGVNDTYKFTGISSLATFAPPFTLSTTVEGIQAHGNPFAVYLVNSDLSQGFNIEGNLNSENGNYYGIWINSVGNNLFYKNPNIGMRYTIQVSVGVDGSASASLKDSSGVVLASQTGLQVGTGPFYVVLGQREGLPYTVGPNVAVWQSVTVNGGASSSTTTSTSSESANTAFAVPDDTWGANNSDPKYGRGACFGFADLELTWFNMRLSQPALLRLRSVYRNCDPTTQENLTLDIQTWTLLKNDAAGIISGLEQNVSSGLQSELKAGRPAMVEMKGNEGATTERHFVIAIGYVETAANIVFYTADSNVPDTAQTLTYDKNAQTWSYYWTGPPWNWSQFTVGYIPYSGLVGKSLFSSHPIINTLLPNPVVKTVDVPQTPVTVNQSFPITVTVKNTGPSAGSFDIRLVDTALLGGWTVATPVKANQNFNAGQSQTFTFNVTATSAGTHSFLGQARVNGSISVDWIGANGMHSANVVAGPINSVNQGTAVASSPSPVIASISSVSPQQTQTITISGTGFGTQNAFNGTSKFLRIHDNTANWEAGYSGDWININVSQWTDTQIVIKGFTGAYGLSEWKFNAGDKLTISVWNAQGGSGPAIYNATVGSNQ